MKHDNARYEAGCRCEDCKEAKAKYVRDRRTRMYLLGVDSLTVDARGVRRRIQALQRIGWRLTDIGNRMKPPRSRAVISHMLIRPKVHVETHRTIAAIYEQLHMTPGPSDIMRQRAERHGWAAPLAWDDIDNDEEPA